MTDLFSWQQSYPELAGHRNVPTSVEAAQKIDSKRKLKLENQAKIKALLHQRGLQGVTTYEAADILQMAHSYVQPRFSELLAKGEIFRSDQRRTNKSGNTCSVFVI